MEVYPKTWTVHITSCEYGELSIFSGISTVKLLQPFLKLNAFYSDKADQKPNLLDFPID